MRELPGSEGIRKPDQARRPSQTKSNAMNLTKKWMHTILRLGGIQVSRISPYTNDEVALSAMLNHARVDLLLDVGANVGQYAIRRFETGYAGRIVSFEPLSGPRAALEKKAAGHPSWCIAEQCALGDMEGSVTMQISDNSEASSLLSATDAHLRYSPHAAAVASEVVKMERLDRVAGGLVEASRSPFLKIDVQGFEKQVLDGTTSILPRLVGLQVELSFMPAYQGQELFPKMLSKINAMGFTVWRFIPAWVDHKTGRWLQADGVFFRS
jgi:FkbM family methyltransferase